MTFRATDFWARVYRRQANDCWPWTARLDTSGYGQAAQRLSGTRKAHRIAWELTNGAPADGILCHRCDNPKCVNPSHLFVGDAAINGADSSRKGRARNQHGGQAQTHCCNGHEYTPENTYWRPGKVAGRDCRACIRDRVYAYRSRRAA